MYVWANIQLLFTTIDDLSEEGFSMLVALSFIVFIILLIYVCKATAEETSKQTKEKEEKENLRRKAQNILTEIKLTHIGGHPYLQTNDNILFQIHKNNSIFFYKENTNTGQEIPINQLVKYEFKTEDQIQRDATFTRFLIFGVASVAMQKKTQIHNEYLYLSYVQNGVNIECLLKNINNEQCVGNIISTLNKIKIESANVEECTV